MCGTTGAATGAVGGTGADTGAGGGTGTDAGAGAGTGAGGGGGGTDGGGGVAETVCGTNVPHALQNLACTPFSAPHFKQRRTLLDNSGSRFVSPRNASPQPLQNFAFSEFAVAHFEQFMGTSLL